MSKKPAAPPPASKTTESRGSRSPRSTIPDAVPLTTSVGGGGLGDAIVIYGTGGIGKTTLAAWLPGALFLDVEHSTKKMSVASDRAETWLELRGKLATIAAAPPEGVQSVIIDSATVAEELAKEHVLQTRKNDRGFLVDSIDGFGWGKGWQYVYDEFTALLADLDRCVARGLHVCLIAHDVPSNVPNPTGEDFIRWEPLLYSGDKKGRASTRALVKNWADHVLWIGYDIHVDEGKATGSGSRSIYAQELPTHIAKSRSKPQLVVTYEIDNPSTVWTELGILPTPK